MTLTPTVEQASYQRSLRTFVTQVLPEDEVRSLMQTDSGFERETWRRMCVELGVAGLAVPEHWGGAGGGMRALVLAFEELGRALSGVPALSSVALAATALLASRDDVAMERWLPDIVTGGLTATLVWPGDGDQLSASKPGGRHVISGSSRLVLDGHSADLLLVVASDEDGVSLFAVEMPDSAVVRRALPTLDLTRKFASLTFDRTGATPVGPPGEGRRILAAASDAARVCLAAEQLGGAARCLEMSLEHAKRRYQFGRPIASFQAVKHRCADVLVACELLRTAVAHAARIADREPAQLAATAALAKAVGSDTFVQAAGANLENHGGIGFTWEHPAHLYLKRAKAMEVFLGTARSQRQVLGEYLGL